MRGGTSPRGYTIIEVMIFLAITGVMFLMAVAFVSGKQNKVQFRQGMNDINSTVQQLINDVSNGTYTSNNNFSCSAGLGLPPTFSSVSPANTQGSNGGCIFLGKVIQFAATNADGSANQANYNIYVVAGRQFALNSPNATQLSASFGDAYPKVVADLANPTDPTDPINLTQFNALTWGLTVTKMVSVPAGGGAAVPIDAVGFFSNFNVNGSSGGHLQSGSQVVNVLTFPPLVPIPASETTVDMEGEINTALDATIPPTPLPNPDIVICFAGGSSQFGSLTIGSDVNVANGQRLTTSIQISSAPPPRC